MSMLICLECLAVFDGTDPEDVECPACSSHNLDNHEADQPE